MDGARDASATVFADGATVTGTLSESVSGNSFAYEPTGFTNSLGRLVHDVRGEFSFVPDGAGVSIRWTDECTPTRRRRLVDPFRPACR